MHAQENQETAATQDRSSAAGSGSYEIRGPQQPQFPTLQTELQVRHGAIHAGHEYRARIVQSFDSRTLPGPSTCSTSVRFDSRGRKGARTGHLATATETEVLELPMSTPSFDQRALISLRLRSNTEWNLQTSGFTAIQVVHSGDEVNFSCRW